MFESDWYDSYQQFNEGIWSMHTYITQYNNMYPPVKYNKLKMCVVESGFCFFIIASSILHTLPLRGQKVLDGW